MKKKLLWVLVLLTVLFGAVNICSAKELTVKAERFYTEFCRMAQISYGSKFCTGSFERTGEGYIFKTVGGFTVKLYTKSPDIELRYAKIYFSVYDKTWDQIWSALLAFYLAADNNLDNLTQSEFEFLQNYIWDITLYLRQNVDFDQIQMYGGIDKGKLYFTAYGR